MKMIEHCHVCKGNDFTILRNQNHQDRFTGEIIKTDLIVCIDCDTIHYEDVRNCICSEFDMSIIKRAAEIKNWNARNE